MLNRRWTLFLIGVLIILSCVSGVKASSEKLDERTVRHLAWSPDGTRIAVGDYTPTIQIWDVTIEQDTFDLKGQDGSAFGLVWSPDGTRIASNSWDKSGINIWDTSTGQLLIKIDEVPHILTLIWLDNNQILTGEEDDNGLHVWDASTGKLIRDYEDTRAGNEATRSADGQILAVIPATNVELLNAKTFNAVDALSLVSDFKQNYQAWAMNWSPFGNTLVVGYMMEEYVSGTPKK
ncbi:MAG: hypothetical protein ABI690_27000 [Chloroflexota bacterium]